MSKDRKYSEEILRQFKPFKVKSRHWVIQVAPSRFLHWIESTNNEMVTVNRPEMAMSYYNFKEQAEAICAYLKVLYSENRPESFDKFKRIEVSVDVYGDEKNDSE